MCTLVYMVHHAMGTLNMLCIVRVSCVQCLHVVHCVVYCVCVSVVSAVWSRDETIYTM